MIVARAFGRRFVLDVEHFLDHQAAVLLLQLFDALAQQFLVLHQLFLALQLVLDHSPLGRLHRVRVRLLQVPGEAELGHQLDEHARQIHLTVDAEFAGPVVVRETGEGGERKEERLAILLDKFNFEQAESNWV